MFVAEIVVTQVPPFDIWPILFHGLAYDIMQSHDHRRTLVHAIMLIQQSNIVIKQLLY